MDQSDLLRQFCEEGIDRLRSFSRGLLALEQLEPPNGSYVELMRTLHSLKGSSRMLGFLPFGNVLHSAEEVLSRLNQLQIRPQGEVIDVLLRMSDTLQDALSAEMSGAGTIPVDSLIPELETAQRALTADPEDFITSLTEHAPDIFHVLSTHQKQLLYRQSDQYEHLYVVSISFRQFTFMEDVGIVHSLLKNDGLMVSTSGADEAPESGYDLRFNFLHLSNRAQEELHALLQEFKAVLRELPKSLPRVPPGTKGSEVSADLVESRKSTTDAGQDVPDADHTISAGTAEMDPADASAGDTSTGLPHLLQHIEFDNEFRELQRWFLDEGEDNLKKLSQEILSLETESTEEKIHSIFRTFHNFKGSGGSYKFPHITRIAHHLESYADTLRQDLTRVNADAIDRMLKGVDVLGNIIAACKDDRHDQLPIQTLEQDIRVTLGMNGKKEESRNSPQSATPFITPSERQDIAPSKRPPESVRIDMGTVDSIVNMAVELSIAHNAEEKLFSSLTDGMNIHFHRSQRLQEMIRDVKNDSAANADPLLSELIELHQHASEDIAYLGTLVRGLERNFSSRLLLAKKLSGEVVDIQLLPLETIFESFYRIVRDLSRSLNKSVTLNISGSDVKVDRKIIDALKDPMIHLIRNAIDHGIETPGSRRTAGKSETGNITVTAESFGYSFSIIIEDDGRGLDRDKIANRAIELGMAAAEDVGAMTDEQVFDYILRPGFTTREVVTDISGRGVGMDVVLSNIKKFGGEVFIHSIVGQGTRFQLLLPCSLLLSNVLIVEANGQLFSLPTGSVERIIALPDSAISMYKGKTTIAYEGSYVAVLDIENSLGFPPAESARRYGVILQKGEKKLCISVPAIVGEEELMTKPLPPHVRNIATFSGANILPDGRISLVLNPVALTAHHTPSETTQPAKKKRRRKRLLIVDDSLVARELLKNILLMYGYDVDTATDGIDGLARLKSQHVDLIVSDIEMPRMNGFEFTHSVKKDGRLKSIPVIIISARDDAEHRRRGMEAGANAYIVKGHFNQNNLISSIETLVPEVE